jgi:hypothetical protein
MTASGLDAVTGTHELELALRHAAWLRRLERFLAREGLLIGVTGLYVAFWAAAAPYLVAADTWLTLLGGREIDARGLPHVDRLTVLAGGRSWIDQQWLAQLVLWHVDRIGGLQLVAVLATALLACPLVVAIVAARRRGASPAAIVPFALFPALFFTSYIRAQLFSQVLFVALLVLLVTESRRPSRRVLLAFPLLALWANLHGAVVEGAALVSLLGLREAFTRRSRLRAAALVVAPWACLLATPYGPSSLDYYRATLWSSALRRTQPEWMAPIHSPLAALIAFPLVAAAFVLVARRRRELNGFEIGVLALAAAAALTATRSIVWLAYAALVLLPPLVQRGDRAPLRRLTVALALAATLAGAGALVATAASSTSRFERSWPPAAAAAVARVEGARVFASPEYADWLLFEVPSLRGRVAFDGRWELLRDGETLALWRFLRQQAGATDAARGYRLLVLDPRRERRLVTRLAGLRVLYRDRSVVVLETER